MSANLFQLFKPGDVLYGYCQGFFGRDDYATKTVVAVNRQYVLLEYGNGSATVINAADIEARRERGAWPTAQDIAAWKVPPEDPFAET